MPSGSLAFWSAAVFRRFSAKRQRDTNSDDAPQHDISARQTRKQRVRWRFEAARSRHKSAVSAAESYPAARWQG
jgi:hypothetical protein